MGCRWAPTCQHPCRRGRSPTQPAPLPRPARQPRPLGTGLCVSGPGPSQAPGPPWRLPAPPVPCPWTAQRPPSGTDPILTHGALQSCAGFALWHWPPATVSPGPSATSHQDSVLQAVPGRQGKSHSHGPVAIAMEGAGGHTPGQPLWPAAKQTFPPGDPAHEAREAPRVP